VETLSQRKAKAAAAAQLKKAEKMALESAQRKRNALLVLKTQEIRGNKWLQDSSRQLPDDYFPGVVFSFLLSPTS
jgi:hypothetical protein